MGECQRTQVDRVALGPMGKVQTTVLVSDQGRSLAKVQYAQASSGACGARGADSSEEDESRLASTCTQRIPCAEQTSTHVLPSAAANQREIPGAIKATHIKTASSPTRQRMALEMKGFLGLRRMIISR